jgi:hypothetical protein
MPPEVGEIEMLSFSLSPIPSTLGGLFVYAIGLIVLWVIVSIPVYFAAKFVTKGKNDFGDAMGATLGGGLAYFIVYYLVAFFLGAVLGTAGLVFAFILGALVWLAVIRASFRTTWIGAIGIVVVAYVILLILDFILVAAFGVSFPNFFPT